MDDDLFLRFLYESEGDSLDFKRDQYKYIGASDDEKSELLKDIISMANSWRRVDGYIIIGILDKPEKPNELVGITEHIDDASLQQFVNFKTNRICEFSYKTFTYNGLTFGILRIPVQKRPIYLKKEYGKLKNNIVYVKRGSSTAEASIDEISQMGKEIIDEKKSPKLDINFYNSKDGVSLGKAIYAKAFNIEISEPIPDYTTTANNWFNTGPLSNIDYYRNFHQYINFYKSYKSFYFQIENLGNIEAKNIKIEITFSDIDLDIKCNGDEPSEPSHVVFLHGKMPHQSEYYIERKSNLYPSIVTCKKIFRNKWNYLY